MSLNTAALALLAFNCEIAMAGRVDETLNTNFQYGRYNESGNNQMEVDIFEGIVTTPIGKSMTGSVSVVRDVISGASQRANRKDINGNIVHAMSGASISEQRDAIGANLTNYFQDIALNFGGGFSRENDYTSRYTNAQISYDLNKKLTTLNLGASIAFDVIEPTNTNVNCSDAKINPQCHKTSQQYLMGLTQVIDKNTLLALNMTVNYSAGFLSDPYKEVYFYDPIRTNTVSGIVLDNRPKHRMQFAWLAQYVHHIESFNHAALHLDYRFGMDDWGIQSHTTELNWFQPLGLEWQLVPRFRYYTQDSADFYAPVFYAVRSNVVKTEMHSSDYRLAGFGGISGGVKLLRDFKELNGIDLMRWQIGIEFYDHKHSYQLGNSAGGRFDDFSYALFNTSFSLKF